MTPATALDLTTSLRGDFVLLKNARQLLASGQRNQRFCNDIFLLPPPLPLVTAFCPWPCPRPCFRPCPNSSHSSLPIPVPLPFPLPLVLGHCPDTAHGTERQTWSPSVSTESCLLKSFALGFLVPLPWGGSSAASASPTELRRLMPASSIGIV